MMDSLFQLVYGFKIKIIQPNLFQVFPNTLNQVQLGSICWKPEDKHPIFNGFQILLNNPSVMIAGIIKNQYNVTVAIPSFDQVP